MGNWIVHIVGETIDDDIAPIISKAVADIQALNHRVRQVRLTTDEGEKIIHVAEKVETDAAAIDKDVDEVAPSLAKEADAAAGAVEAGGKEAEKVVDDIETKEGTPLGEVPISEPVSSATPEVDTASAPALKTTEAPAPVDPPLAGASSIGSSPTSTTPTAIPS